jgi:hypothetical protein
MKFIRSWKSPLSIRDGRKGEMGKGDLAKGELGIRQIVKRRNGKKAIWE